MIRQGDILEGKYKILEKIGQGGMSKVWLAMDMTLNKQWAVKEIDKRKEEYKKTVNEHQTLTEIDIMKKLSHPSLPRIVSVIDEPSSLCVVMDYIEGESLDKVLYMYGRQPENTVVAWTLEICDVLDYLHHQNPPIIYRDMKPSNVMLSQEGHIKIIDFGIAREYKGGRDDTLPLGTRGYASPEHFTKQTDARSDVYTVGVTMYQLLTGLDPAKPPYKILPLREVDPNLSTGLEKVIKKATMLDPNERYQTIQEMANAVNSFRKLDDEYINTLKTRIKGFKKRIGASAAIIVIGLGLIAGGTLAKNHNYNALMNSSTIDPEKRAEELKQAIELKPDSENGYLELIKVYAKDGNFTEQEAADFLVIYNANKDKLENNKDEYAKTNYAIGEAFLKYYNGTNDNSSRAKLLAAEPYFQAANVDGFSKKTLATDYVFMAEYYKSYVLADDSLVAEDPSKSDYTKLLKKCAKTIRDLEEYQGQGKTKMCMITYQVMINLIDGQRNGMAEAGISKSNVMSVVNRMRENVDSFSKESEDSDITKTVKSQLKELSQRVTLSYQTVEKESQAKSKAETKSSEAKKTGTTQTEKTE